MSTVEPKKITKSKRKTKHYVDNKKFYDDIVAYKKRCYEAEMAGKDKPPIPDFSALCVFLIAQNVIRMPAYNGYSYKDEMASDAMMNCIRYFDNFDENKYTNPHAYFTMICSHACKNRINEEKKLRYALYKKFEEDYVLTGNHHQLLDEKNNLIEPSIYDNISEYIEDYEIKDREKKARRIQKMKEKKKQEELRRVDGDDIDEE